MGNFLDTISQSWVWQYVLSHFGWVDWTLTVFFLMGIVSGLKGGLGRELPRTVEGILVIYVTVEYYLPWSEWLALKTPLPEPYARVLSFLVIGFSTGIILRLLFELFGKFITLQVASPFQWMGGLFLGGVRFVICFSFLSYLLSLFPLDWIHRSYQVQSWSGQKLVELPNQVHRQIKDLLTATRPAG